MSIDYYLYSSLPPKKLAQVVQGCEKQIETWSEARLDYDDVWGEMELGGRIPSSDEALDLIWLDEEELDEKDGPIGLSHPAVKCILDRLPQMRSALTIERPGDFDFSPMQVSIMRYLIQNSDTCLVQLVDVLQTSESVMDLLDEAVDVEQSMELEPEQQPRIPSPNTDSVAEVLKYIVAKTEQLIKEGTLEMHPMAIPKTLAEDILDFLYAKEPAPTAADFIEWLLERKDIEEVYGDDSEIHGQFVPS